MESSDLYDFEGHRKLSWTKVKWNDEPLSNLDALAVVVRSRHLATVFGSRPLRAATDRVLLTTLGFGS